MNPEYTFDAPVILVSRYSSWIIKPSRAPEMIKEFYSIVIVVMTMVLTPDMGLCCVCNGQTSKQTATKSHAGATPVNGVNGFLFTLEAVTCLLA